MCWGGGGGGMRSCAAVSTLPVDWSREELPRQLIAETLSLGKAILGGSRASRAGGAAGGAHLGS